MFNTKRSLRIVVTIVLALGFLAQSAMAQSPDPTAKDMKQLGKEVRDGNKTLVKANAADDAKDEVSQKAKSKKDDVSAKREVLAGVRAEVAEAKTDAAVRQDDAKDEKKFKQADKKLEQAGKKLDKIDKQIDQAEQQRGHADRKLDHVDKKLKQVDKDIAQAHKKLAQAKDPSAPKDDVREAKRAERQAKRAERQANKDDKVVNRRVKREALTAEERQCHVDIMACRQECGANARLCKAEKREVGVCKMEEKDCRSDCRQQFPCKRND